MKWKHEKEVKDKFFGFEMNESSFKWINENIEPITENNVYYLKIGILLYWFGTLYEKYWKKSNNHSYVFNIVLSSLSRNFFKDVLIDEIYKDRSILSISLRDLSLSNIGYNSFIPSITIYFSVEDTILGTRHDAVLLSYNIKILG